MATVPINVEVPNDAEIDRQLRETMPALYLYYGGDDWFKQEFGGRMYYIPPDKRDQNGRPKPVPHPVDRENGQPKYVAADGKLGVRDVWGFKRNKSLKKSDAQEIVGIGPAVGQSASEIIKHFVREYGKYGVIWLTGNQTEDEKRKKAARARYLDGQRAWAEEQKAARVTFKENFKKNNPNQAIPAPTPMQQRAQDILDNIASERRGKALYVCEVCYDKLTDDWDDFVKHSKVAHGITPRIVGEPGHEEVVVPEVKTEAADPEPKPKRGWPKGKKRTKKVEKVEIEG